jgi:large subunit ribosomal protein L31
MIDKIPWERQTPPRLSELFTYEKDHAMKEGIHPEYKEVSIECVCGKVWHMRSTANLQKVDICSNCHPFYTGKQKVMDSEGRIEKFRKKYGQKK